MSHCALSLTAHSVNIIVIITIITELGQTAEGGRVSETDTRGVERGLGPGGGNTHTD